MREVYRERSKREEAGRYVYVYDMIQGDPKELHVARTHLLETSVCLGRDQHYSHD